MAISPEMYVAYVAACILIVVVPGPTVTVIVANSLAHGTRAGLLNVVGTQLGLAMLLCIVAAGVATVMATAGWWFDWIRLIGAAYLVWLGWRMIRSSASAGAPAARRPPRGGFVVQGFVVIVTNPKGLLWFGAFIPQFIDPTGNYLAQVMLLGLTAMAVAAIFDGAYALLVGRAGAALSGAQTRLVARASGAFLICGGVWLALSRAR